MSLWTQLFRRRPARSHTSQSARRAARFRPAVRELEDRSVPAADMFVNATMIGGTYLTTTGSNVGATGEPGEQPIAGTGGADDSVWWKWTAPVSGRVEINTDGSDFDTVLGVFVGNDVANLASIVENDDYYDFQSRVVFDAVAGTTYHIGVDGYTDTQFGIAEQGNIVLNLAVALPNDNFASAATLTGTQATATGFYNLAATDETGEPDHAGVSTPLNSLWWSWTPAATGDVVIDTFGSDYDTTLAVYTGSSVGGLTFVAANDDFGGLQSRVTFTAQAGTTYRIAVDGNLQWTGAIQLKLDQDAAPPANSPPVINDQVFSVNENSAAGTAVGTVVASDPDAGQSLTYSIVSVNGQSSGWPFAINSSTGALTVATGGALNYEAVSSYAVVVKVTDNGTPNLWSSATVTVNVNNLNEAPVNTVPAAQTAYANVPHVVHGISVADPDAPAGAISVTLSVAHGTLAVGTAVSGGVPSGGIGGNGTATVVLTGTVSQINATLAAGVTYSPAVGYSGADTLTVYTNDLGNTGAGGPLTDTDTVSISVLSAAQQAQLLIDQVEALYQDGTLTTGEANSLLTKLALKGNSGDADRIRVFIAKVNEFVSAGVMTAAEAAPLLDMAYKLLAGL